MFTYRPFRRHCKALPTHSRQVSSNQPHTHHRLASVVRRHLRTVNRAPISRHSLQAYRVLANELSAKPRPVVLDSFCGTGLSTAALAARYPGHLVIGIDKSAARLNKHTGEPADNCLLLQADCGEIWKLLAADGCKLDRHFLLYPNPWPKAKHLQRRIHGHHSFPLLLLQTG